MNPFYQDNHIRIFNKDCRQMSELPDESVQCVVTSPPYFGLRKYSGEQELIWGDKGGCEHQWGRQLIAVQSGGGLAKGGNLTGGDKNWDLGERSQGSFCSLCGAWRGALGLEPTMELYLLHLIEIMREIKRVLRKDGTFFLNIGDSYAGSGSPGGDFRDGKGGDEYLRPYNRKGGVLKPKDICLTPQRLMIAAQEDGWWVRSVIIWSKLNTMPESVNGWRWEQHRIKMGNRGRKQAAQEGHFQDHRGDNVVSDAIWEDCPGCPKCKANDGYVLRKGSWRPTESHEYILMLTKTDTYYCDAEAVRELSTEKPSGNKERKYRRDYGGPEAHTGRQGFSIPYEPSGTGRNLRSVWEFPEEKVRGLKTKGEQELSGQEQHHGQDIFPQSGSRNLRSVWAFATMPFPSFKIGGRELEHFAVFPEKLPELCIKAATPEVGCCSKCGAPWARVIKHHRPGDYDSSIVDKKYAKSARKASGYDGTNRPLSKIFKDTLGSRTETIGWRATCKCNAPRVPSLVVDPMAGAGTTLWVAKELNRYAVGYELSQEYCQLAVERCRQQVLL